MINLKKLGFVFSLSTLGALSAMGCSDDAVTPAGTAGSPSGGGGAATAGAPAAGTTSGGSSAGSSTGGSSAGGGAGGSSAGSGTGGSTAGGGAGGSSAGGGAGGSSAGGGAGGSSAGGGAGGSSAGGGAGGGGGAGPSADCKKWCQGAMGVVQFCAGSGLAPAVDSEAKCIANCTTTEAMDAQKGLSCWLKHLDNAQQNANGAKTTHCPHASGAQDQTVCNKTK